MKNIFDNYTALNEIRPLPFSKLDSESVRLLGWNFPVEALHLVHPHWRGYPAPPYHFHLFMFLIYFGLMISSLFGNGMVIWIFTTSKSLRTPSNLFIVNLALFDFIMMLEIPMFLVNSCYETIVGYETACNIYAALGSVSGIGGAVTNAAIAFDRFKTISSPIDGRLNFVQAGILVFITWIWTVPFTLFPYLKIWGRFIPEGFLTTCTFDYLSEDDDTKVFVGSIFAWVYCLPMILIIFCYSRLFMHVRAHEKMLQDQAKKMNVKSLSANQTNSTSVEIRIARVAFTIFFLYVCAWTPYAMVALIGAFGNKNILSPVVSMIPAVASKIVSCLDPWVYAISHPKYRMELEKRIPWLGISEKETKQSQNANEAGSIVSDVSQS